MPPKSIAMPQLTEDQTSLVGKESAPRPAPYAINEAMARFWCEMVEDGNPIYFDEEYANSTWLDAPFAPPAMLFTWGMPPVWPEGARQESMISRLSLPGCTATLAVNATQEYVLPLRYGDTLTITNQIASIGEEKTTRLGTGHFITTLDTFRNQRNEVAGTHSFTLFMYGPAAAPVGTQHQPPHSTSGVDPKATSTDAETKPPDAAPLNSADVHASPGEVLPPITLPLTLRRAIQAVAGTRDYYPFHHDEQFARENGVEGIFFNTMFLQAFAGRCVTEWFGNDAFLRRLEIAMRAPNYVGRTLTVDARVAGVREEGHRRLVDVEGTLLTEDGPTTGVKWVVEVPLG
jgi:acyl dehydratase